MSVSFCDPYLQSWLLDQVLDIQHSLGTWDFIISFLLKEEIKAAESFYKQFTCLLCLFESFWNSRPPIYALLPKCFQQLGLGWARLKPGAKNSFWVFHVGRRDPTPLAITCCLAENTLPEVEIRGGTRMQRHSDMECEYFKEHFNCSLNQNT